MVSQYGPYRACHVAGWQEIQALLFTPGLIGLLLNISFLSLLLQASFI